MSSSVSETDQQAYALRTLGLDAGALRGQLEKLSPWYACFLAPWLPADRAAPLIDTPCGAGNLLWALRDLGYTAVEGVDGDAGQVALARELGLPARVGDAIAAVEGKVPGSIARIFSVDFVEHLSREEAIRFCAAARRALLPGGLLLLRTPSADGPFGAHDRYNDLTHRIGLSAGAAVQLLQLAGFQAGGVTVVQEAPVPYRLRNRLRRAAFNFSTRLIGAWLEFCGIGAPSVWTRSMWLVARAPLARDRSADEDLGCSLGRIAATQPAD